MGIVISIVVLLFMLIRQHFELVRVEAEYGVLKTRIEKLEEDLRNGR